MTSNADLVARIRDRGLPDVVSRIAREGGEAVSPALFYRAEAVWPETAEAVLSGTAEDLVPLGSCDATHAFAGQDRFLVWSAESDEPYAVFDTFVELVREMLTDFYEDKQDDDERWRIAHLLLPPDDAAAALVPFERRRAELSNFGIEVCRCRNVVEFLDSTCSRSSASTSERAG